MKFNKWTLGLAAIGAVSLASAANADEQLSPLNTALSNTTLSGYVDTSIQYNPGMANDGTAPNYSFGSKANSVNLNVVDLALDHPEAATPWAAGYHVDLWAGPDANGLNTSSSGFSFNDFAIRQAYLTLNTPVGNGIDWKVGVFDTIIGYEGLTSGNNPNYSRSYGFSMEPTTHTGVLGTYKVNDEVTVQAGLADTSTLGGGAYAATINGASGFGGYFGLNTPTVLADVSLTAPDNFGALKGATLYGGVITTGGNTGATSLYVGATTPTPWSAVKFGGSFDYLDIHSSNSGVGADSSAWNIALYSTYQASDKLSFNFRGEYSKADGYSAFTSNVVGGNNGEELTVDAQYNLWANVISRVEARWDHVEHGSIGGLSTDKANAFLLAAQFIYQF